jgi:hypothetical protein
MKPIPQTEDALVLRADFGDETAWKKICAIIQKPVGVFRFRANVHFLDDPQYAGIDKEQLLQLTSRDYEHTFIFVADHMAMTHPEHPLLVIDLYESSGQSFRAIPRQVQSIENNLSIANMDFEDFAGSADADGIFRDFPHP